MKKIDLQPNQIIDDRYTIIEPLGQGGMGAVWKASDARTNGSLVVLKIPLDYNNTEMLKRFSVEARSMRELAGGCVNILDIQDIGSVKVSEIDDVPYYVTRFQTGGTLSDWKCPTNAAGQPIYSRESFKWVNGITDALEYLHHPDRKIFHRDIKPANIFFNAGGTPLLSDFGIVKDSTTNTVDSQVVTDPRMSIGTPQYMAPEILRQQEYTPQADQYSLAVTIYEAIAGELPYQGSNLFVLRDAFEAGHRKLDQLPGEFPQSASKAIDRALSQKPEDRFASCRDFANAFLQALPSEEDQRKKPPSELPTGMHLGTENGSTGGGKVVGGTPIAPKPPIAGGHGSGGKLFPEPPIKPTPPPVSANQVAGSGISKAATFGLAALLLAGLLGGGLFLSGALSGTDTNNQPQAVGPGSSASTSSTPAPSITSEKAKSSPSPIDVPSNPRPQELTNSIGMKFRLISAGEFMMGSRKSAKAIAELFDSKESNFSDEHPRHRVSITRDFYLGKHEVTVGQFRQFVSDTGYKTEPEKSDKGGRGFNQETEKFEDGKQYSWRDPGFPQTDRHPVANVTWNDAVAFCEWLSKKEGEEYRLPTEAQWEYSCRGGTSTLYHHGDDPEGLTDVANVADGTAKDRFDHWTAIKLKDGHVFSSEVGTFKNNAYGLYDMHGNVWEWCSDWYADDYYEGSPQRDPEGPDDGSPRVYRGGSWDNSSQSCRSAFRFRDSPDYRDNFLGFRVLRSSIK